MVRTPPARSQRLTSWEVRGRKKGLWKLISKNPLPENVAIPVEIELPLLGPQSKYETPRRRRPNKPPKNSHTVSRFLNAHFRAPVLLAVERELRLGKHERADEAAGSAIQFLICRTRSRDPSVTIWSTKLRQ